MSDPKMVQATHGPYAGKRLTMSPEDADAAISDGWAVDPFAPPPAEDDKPKEPESEEERVRKIEAAEKAARKLRGEDEPADEKTKKPAKSASEQRRTMEASPAHDYETRGTRHK